MQLQSAGTWLLLRMSVRAWSIVCSNIIWHIWTNINFCQIDNKWNQRGRVWAEARPVLPTYTRYPLCDCQIGPKQAPKKSGYAQSQVPNHRLIGPTVGYLWNDYPRRGWLRPHKVCTLGVSESCSGKWDTRLNSLKILYYVKLQEELRNSRLCGLS